jgi:hypothetical protein
MLSSATLEVCRVHLYNDEQNIPERYRERVKRIRTGYSFWYEFATKTESDVRDHLMNEFECSKRTAYEDIQIIKVLLGDIKNASKEFIRFQVNAMFDAAYAMAEKQKDPKAMAAAAANKAKYNMLHIPDAQPMPFDQIVPQPFEPTDDPTSLGLKRDPEIREKKRKMLEKYASEIEIIDVPYEEMIKDDSQPEEENLL